MAIFNSYVKLPEGNGFVFLMFDDYSLVIYRWFTYYINSMVIFHGYVK